jgi:hypothetical protein
MEPHIQQKLNLSLHLVKHHTMKVYGRVEVQTHTFLTGTL